MTWLSKFCFGTGVILSLGGIGTAVHAIYEIDKWSARCALLETETLLYKKQLEAVGEDKADKLIISVAYDEQVNKTLAVKNRNFLNIKVGREPWKGQIGTDKYGHAIFEDPVWSIRAGAIVLRSYEHKHKINTIDGLVRRFAEGNHEDYAKYLCRELNVKKDEKISFTAHMPELIRAMVKFEMGQYLPDKYYDLLKSMKG